MLQEPLADMGDGNSLQGDTADSAQDQREQHGRGVVRQDGHTCCLWVHVNVPPEQRGNKGLT